MVILYDGLDSVNSHYNDTFGTGKNGIYKQNGVISSVLITGIYCIKYRF